MSKIKVDTFNKIPIYFDKSNNQFSCKYEGQDYQDRDLISLKEILQKVSKTVFKGQFYVKYYDGIRKFTANRKYIDRYSDEEVIYGIEIDKFGRSRNESYKKEKLYPMTTFNTKLYEEGKGLIDEGWRLIRQGEDKAIELKK